MDDAEVAMDFSLIDAAKQKHETASEHWDKFENVYRNLLDKDKIKLSKTYNRAYSQTPIAHDTVEIKRSIFSASFQSSPLPLNIRGFGEVGEEVARQTRLAANAMWERNSPFVEINKAMLRMLVFPVAVLLCYWDGQKKKIVTKEINPMDICFDPEASGADDVQYYTYDRYMTMGELKRLSTKGKKKKPWFNKVKKLDDVIENYDKETFKRFERVKLVELYTLEENGKWRCRTYLAERKKLLHEQLFDRSPFVWGYALDKMSSVDESTREDEVMVYGQSEIEILKPYVDEMIMRKNQLTDIIEKQINPDVFVGKKSGVKANLLKQGGGTYIPVDDPSKIRDRPAPTPLGVMDSIETTKKDIEDTSAINGFYKAQTSASDRRSTGAIALLEGKASTRIEMQILTAKTTLFDHFAQNYVSLVYSHTPATLLSMLDVEDTLIGAGVLGKPKIKEVLTVEFGVDVDGDRRASSYLEAAQVLGQFQNADPVIAQELVSEALKLKVGDERKIPDSLFMQPDMQEESVAESIPADEGGVDVIGGI